MVNEIPLPRRGERQSAALGRPFRRTVLRGMAVLLPPLVTVLIFLWAWNTIQLYLLNPSLVVARRALVWSLADVRQGLDGEQAQVDGRTYIRARDGMYVPQEVYETVRAHGQPMPRTADEVYGRYVELRYLHSQLVTPLFFAGFVLAMYLVGRFLAAGAGRVAVELFDRSIARLPLVRSVYSSVKHLTVMALNQNPEQSLRVVGVQYPREGVWAVAFVTGVGMEGLGEGAGEPLYRLLVPTSPKAVTGFTAVLPKSQTIELDLTLEQALQYLISCGIVVPPSQLPQTRR